jgi:ribonuclease Z
MRRLLVCVIGIGLALGMLVVIALRVPAVQDLLVRQAIDRRLATQPGQLFAEDALRVLLCGTSSPLPHPTRAKSCVALFAAGHFYVVDVGPGSWNRLALWRVDASRIGGILLTHFHSDHIGELGEFALQTWAAGRPEPLRVFGPPGVARVVAGFEQAYAFDTAYRVAHHGGDLMSPELGRMQARPIVGPAAGTGPAIALEENGLTITALAVDHAPVAPAYAYRFDYGGRSVVVSGDSVKHEALIEAARGVDVLVHEAQARHLLALIREAAEQGKRPRVARIMGDIPDYHTSAVEAAEVANEAGVGLLVLYHLTPPPPRLAEGVFVRGVSDVRPRDWILGDDGLLVELPTHANTVNVSRLD